ncbi:MAG: hypothetical protein M1819_004678 [Sarea resinae]|nr:MAG: hypothetical protein M1819_004678 [Sarea resinae]
MDLMSALLRGPKRRRNSKRYHPEAVPAEGQYGYQYGYTPAPFGPARGLWDPVFNSGDRYNYDRRNPPPYPPDHYGPPRWGPGALPPPRGHNRQPRFQLPYFAQPSRPFGFHSGELRQQNSRNGPNGLHYGWTPDYGPPNRGRGGGRAWTMSNSSLPSSSPLSSSDSSDDFSDDDEDGGGGVGPRRPRHPLGPSGGAGLDPVVPPFARGAQQQQDPRIYRRGLSALPGIRTWRLPVQMPHQRRPHFPRFPNRRLRRDPHQQHNGPRFPADDFTDEGNEDSDDDEDIEDALRGGGRRRHLLRPQGLPAWEQRMYALDQNHSPLNRRPHAGALDQVPRGPHRWPPPPPHHQRGGAYSRAASPSDISSFDLDDFVDDDDDEDEENETISSLPRSHHRSWGRTTTTTSSASGLNPFGRFGLHRRGSRSTRTSNDSNGVARSDDSILYHAGRHGRVAGPGRRDPGRVWMDRSSEGGDRGYGNERRGRYRDGSGGREGLGGWNGY